jgi:hypothetical protein
VPHPKRSIGWASHVVAKLQQRAVVIPTGAKRKDLLLELPHHHDRECPCPVPGHEFNSCREVTPILGNTANSAISYPPICYSKHRHSSSHRSRHTQATIAVAFSFGAGKSTPNSNGWTNLAISPLERRILMLGRVHILMIWHGLYRSLPHREGGRG